MKIVLGPWTWYTPLDDEPYWGAPKGSDGCLDLRSIPDQSIAGGSPKGFAVFSMLDGAPDPGSGYRTLGTSLGATIKAADLTIIGSQLGVGSLKAGTLDLLMYELATVKADPTGLTFARPFMPSMQREVGISLAGQRVHYEVFNHESIQHAAAIKQIREQYRTNKILSSTGYMAPDHYRRCLDFTQKKLGLPWEALIPPDMTGEPGPLKHRTIVPDDFNRANEALEASADWTEIAASCTIVSNVVVSDASSGIYRNENDLSSDDQTVKANANGGGDTTGTRRLATYARINPASTNTGTLSAYLCDLRLNEDRVRLLKWVSGTPTVLDTNDADAYGDSTTYAVDTQASASAISGLIDTVTKVSISDSAVSGYVRHGLGINNDGDGVCYLDNYRAADLAAPSGPITGRHYPRGVMRGEMRGVA